MARGIKNLLVGMVLVTIIALVASAIWLFSDNVEPEKEKKVKDIKVGGIYLIP